MCHSGQGEFGVETRQHNIVGSGRWVRLHLLHSQQPGADSPKIRERETERTVDRLSALVKTMYSSKELVTHHLLSVFINRACPTDRVFRNPLHNTLGNAGRLHVEST